MEAINPIIPAAAAVFICRRGDKTKRMNLLQAEIQMNAMIAENKQREILGQSLAYGEKDFMSLINEHKIHHNNFPFYSGY